MTTSRRKFIKISALGFGGFATVSTAYKMFGGNSYIDAVVKQNIADKFKRTATYCEVCFWKCAAWAYSNDEAHIQKIIANEKDFII